jgi:3-oxoacyl-[acyl-carrier protein] reductase
LNNVNRSKKILITGGSRGIGAFAVRRFTSMGAVVAFLYNKSQREAFELSKETGALAVRCDVSNPRAVESAMEVVNDYMDGEIDVLICNAGISDFGLVTDIGYKRWNEVINTNLNGAYYCIDKVLPGMISAKKGSIIIVSSMWGQVGASCEVAYSASKAGLIGLTKALAKELGPSGIRVNCIAPGMIDTDMNANVSESAVHEIVEETPLMRIGKPADVVGAMEFLASEKSSFITGQVIGVNGGLVI